MGQEQGQPLEIIACGSQYKEWQLKRFGAYMVDEDAAGNHVFVRETVKTIETYLALQINQDIYHIIYKKIRIK